ncbi:trehalose-phosphatase [Mycobacterium intracellulare 1956]|uniref:Trehalose 6-phosphate phosphatase n=3 Tax=Mycobacterium intracellulare TaxID=1767 RepID=X8CBZ5_MYCIT|nr:trehalose-phosphatase [Mycobacterium intracellulare]ASW87143.1 trehalose-phosphatase [Mycobacterium intracellulare]EUA28364.1 trehalose-phosphatase [Mycobacterium intracellulare]EUA52978.1 trehalose-phosphatase [Mycobacterium intracellulare 1956]
MPVIIDPRRHDAVLFDLETDLGSTLAARLRDVGVGTAVVPADGPARAAADLKVRPGRAVVVARAAAGVEAARAAGFASVIGVGPAKSAGALRDAGADAVVSDLGEVGVRTGDLRMSQLPDAMRALTDAADGLAGRRPAVFFDFDGTLSDIVDDPDAARPVAGATEALAKLADGCPVAVLSGRDLADVTNRVGVPGIWYAGSHGFELTAPDGTHHQNDAAAAAIPVLEQAAARLRDQLGGIPGVVVEHKRFGVAVHYRNAERDRVGEVLAAVRAAGRRDALRVTTGREVIELRPDLDWDKGKTLRWVIDHLHRAGSGSLTPVYLGDDITDEDAFDAVHDDGVPILVRHSDDGDRATAALFALDSPARAAAFTDRLADQLEA